MQKLTYYLGQQQPTWRLWGEERLDGAVYTVYLKKVRYHSPSRTITTVGRSVDAFWHGYIVFLSRILTMAFRIWNGKQFAFDSSKLVPYVV